MKRFSQGSIAFWFVLIVASLFLLACDLGSLVSQGNAPSTRPTDAAAAPPTGPAAAQPTQGAVPQSKDAQTRISSSIDLILQLDKKVFDSYHFDVSGTEPEWNKDKNAVVSQAFTFKADVAGDNVHFVKTTKTDKETVTEGYLMNGSAKDGEKGYSVQGGKLKEDLFMMLNWATLPLDYGFPLIFASAGPTPLGEEAIDGRAADKFDVDLGKAPTGVAGMLKGFGFNMTSSKGTAWVDKQTGTLLKMNLDYARDVLDAGKVVGQGSGHIELVVSQVGKVKVTLPDVSSSVLPAPTTSAVATVAPTAVAAASPTAAPAASVVKVGQRVVVQGVALTVTKAQALDTLGGKKADAGKTWVVATVTVENAGNARISISEQQFEYVDNSGATVKGLLTGTSAPGTSGTTVFGTYQLVPGGKMANKTLPIQMKKELVPGLKLLFTIDKDNSISVNLGL